MVYCVADCASFDHRMKVDRVRRALSSSQLVLFGMTGHHDDLSR